MSIQYPLQTQNISDAHLIYSRTSVVSPLYPGANGWSREFMTQSIQSYQAYLLFSTSKHKNFEFHSPSLRRTITSSVE